MPNWNRYPGTSLPQAWWATHPVLGVGVENLSIDNSASLKSAGVGAAIVFFNAANSWVKGVRSLSSSRAHVEANYANRITVRDSYFWLSVFSTSTSYGVECEAGSDFLVENNIFQAVSGPLTIDGACSGSVLGYNFDINNFYVGSAGYINAMSNVHTAGTDSILYEGNIGPQIYGDLFHGTHNLVTEFRNYLIGNQPACWASGTPDPYPTGVTFGSCTNDQEPSVQLAYSRFFNIIGNVLGQTSIQKYYEHSVPSTGAYPSIFQLGFGSGSVPNDTNVEATLMRWGNYDTVTSTVRFVSTEVPSSLTGTRAPYSNPLPASQTLPNSFYYNSGTPSWWPSGKNWPLIGPDVTGGNVSGVAGHVYTNPAEDCYTNVMAGPSDGSGGALSFNAATCYSTTAPVVNAPATVTFSIQ